MSAFDFSVVRYTEGTLAWAVAPRRGVSIGKQIGRVTTNGYVRVTYRGRNYGVHRLVWEFHNGEIPEGYEVDHLNGVRTDNRIENLRLATRSQNSMNHRMHSHNSTGTKGLGTRVRGNCLEFVGRIRVDGKVHMKSSVNKDIVLDWLTRMRPALHGEFANGGYH